jgi:hypothetical protein
MYENEDQELTQQHKAQKGAFNLLQMDAVTSKERDYGPTELKHGIAVASAAHSQTTEMCADADRVYELYYKLTSDANE